MAAAIEKERVLWDNVLQLEYAYLHTTQWLDE